MPAIRVTPSKLCAAAQRSLAIPEWYHDELVTCRGCAKQFTFTAQQQRHLYEVQKVSLFARRQLCMRCKLKLSRLERDIAKLETQVAPKGMRQSLTLSDWQRYQRILSEKSRLRGKPDSAKLQRISKEIALRLSNDPRTRRRSSAS